MKLKVEIEGQVDATLNARSLAVGEVVILVKPIKPSGWQVGDILARSMNEMVNLTRRDWSMDPSAYLVRRLQPGERVVISQEL